MLHRKKVTNPVEAVIETAEHPETPAKVENVQPRQNIKEKSVLRLTKDLIEAGNELKRQIEESRVEREEFKKLLNSKTEVKTEVKTEEPETTETKEA